MMIASRVLTLRKGKNDVEIPIRIFAPKKEKNDWSCRVEIGWPDETFAMDIVGIDAVQALDLALKMAGAQIYGSDHHLSGRLTWLEPGKGYGFPVPNNVRDLLIGDDAKYL